MALPGLNTEGTRISVLPQYTPSNMALDLSALGSGLQQGMQIVGQAQQARRLRDIIAEEQARRPLMELERTVAMNKLSQPIETVDYTFTSPTEDGSLGRYGVVTQLDPVSGQRQQINKLLDIVATPAQIEAEQAQAALKARQIEAEIAERLARAEAAGKTPTRQPFKGETTEIMENGKPVKYAVVYDENGVPSLGRRLGEAVPRSSALTQDDFMAGLFALANPGSAQRAPAPTVSALQNELVNFASTPPALPIPQGTATVQFRMPGQEPQLSGVDQQALQWARSNPNDPRSALILQRLGLQ